MKPKKQKVDVKRSIVTVIILLFIVFVFDSLGKVAILLDSPGMLTFLVRSHALNPAYLWDEPAFFSVIIPRYSYVSFAIEHNSRKTFEKLLSLGAISSTDKDFQEACRRALLEATHQEDVYWIRELGKAGVDLNSDWGGYPMFFYAIKNINILKYYLDNGIDVNQLPLSHHSALREAVVDSKFDAAYLLLNHGASIDDCEIWKFTNNAPVRGVNVITSQMEVMRQKVLTRLRELGLQNRCHEN